MGKYAGAVWLLVCLSFAGIAQEKAPTPQNSAAEFKIPPEAAKRANPVRPTEFSIAEGRRVYKTQCAMCHGAAGDGKGELAEVMALKLLDYRDAAALKDFTDGELFYVLNKGKGQMPGQEGRMKPAQQWHLINFIRWLAKREPANKPKN